MQLKRIVRSAGVVSLACASLAAASASAVEGPAQIEYGRNYFTPSASGPVDVRPFAPEGVWDSQETNFDHSVFEDSGFFRSGRPGEGQEFREEIPAGEWHYYCEVHGSVLGGMDGTITVRPSAGRGNGTSALIRWADHDASSRNAYEVEWRRQGKKWQAWEKSTSERKLEFGLGGSPVVAEPGQKYEVRVRSFVARNPSKTSRVSPATTFKVND
jgi:hypothetical protein